MPTMSEAQKDSNARNASNANPDTKVSSIPARGTGELSLLPEDLQKCSWEQLLEMFSRALQEHEQIDTELQEQTMELLKVIMNSPTHHEHLLVP